MKTAGQLLREKRELRELTLEQTASLIKVKPEYLRALENSDFDSLPGVTTTKGFLRNYAKALHLEPETLLAMLRRDFEIKDHATIIPRGLVKPLSTTRHKLSAPRVLLLSAVITFFGFLVYQLFSWWALPKILLSQPKEGEIYGDKLTVKGKTQADNIIIVDGQKVLLDSNGEFSLDLGFTPGTHELIVTATDRKGRSTSVKRTFTVSK